jgi:TolB-like protein
MAALVALLVTAGCGHYSTTSRTAKDISSIHVPFFGNETAEPNLEITVTETIIQNLIDDNTLKVVARESADALLEGRIVEFQNRPFSYNNELNAEEYHVSVRVLVTLLNRKTNQPMWRDRSMQGTASYFVEQVENGNTFEDAVAEAITQITERILNLTTQDW